MERAAGTRSTPVIFGEPQPYLTPRPGDLRLFGAARASRPRLVLAPASVDGRSAPAGDAAVLAPQQGGRAAARIERRGRLDDEHELRPPRCQGVADGFEGARDRGHVAGPEIAGRRSAVGEGVESGG